MNFLAGIVVGIVGSALTFVYFCQDAVDLDVQLQGISCARSKDVLCSKLVSERLKGHTPRSPKNRDKDGHSYNKVSHQRCS